MKAIVLGSNSDIIKAISPILNYETYGWSRQQNAPPSIKWDVCLIAIGSTAPVGHWWQNDMMEWDQCMQANLVIPFELLQMIWPNRNPGATVVWFTGSNPQTIMSGYSAYNTAKMAVNKLVEQMDYESVHEDAPDWPDSHPGVACRFIAFNPGYIATKIHKPTHDAAWPNDRIAKGGGSSYEDVARTLAWCIENRHLCGGRNICVDDVKNGMELPRFVRITQENAYKLRRIDEYPAEARFAGLG